MEKAGAFGEERRRIIRRSVGLVADRGCGQGAAEFDGGLEKRGGKCPQNRAIEKTSLRENDHEQTPLDGTSDHEVDARDVVKPASIEK
jgi:hypothetical protein